VKQNSFQATNWLNQNAPSNGRVMPHSYSLNQGSVEDKVFNPGNFVTPGWSGESLISKNGIKVKKILMKLWADCIQQFKGLSQANRSLQELIFEQFKAYCKENNSKINKVFLERSEHLLREISLPSTKMNPVVLDFIKVSSFKSVTLYLYKVKFLSRLSNCLDLELNEQNLKNPSYFFQKVFKTTSQNNIAIKSLQKNSYSWYRPSSTINLKIVSIVKVLESISITELMKITSFSNYIKTQKTTYPHSISHQEFGKLMNELLIHFPSWIEDENNSKNTTKNLDVISVNFSGQHVTSLSQSHWLAQNSSDPKKWKKLIFPFFTQREKNDSYIKYCHELQFLSFLTQLAQTYDKNPVKYIAEVYQEKDQANMFQGHEFGQTSLFDNLAGETKNPLFHRVVLNLSELPKKNPHHYLTSQIISEFSKITNDGYLVILTNQKLFVPSYQEKVKQVLQIANLEAEFNLEGLKNKGEVPDYIYIFSNKAQTNKFLNNEIENNKSSYTSFSLEGTLNQFQLLQLFSKELQYIWENKKSTTPIYQKDLARDFVLKFHQSVVLDGKNLENENQSQNSITHPNFYRNLATNSLTLDNFFKIEAFDNNISPTEKHYLFSSAHLEEKAPYILIVHTPDYLASSIEIIHSDALEARKQQYGEAFYQYYNLTPISKGININIFREYFNSNIGKQIIKLTLGGAATKIKSKIRSLLIPKKFFHPVIDELKDQLPSSFGLINMSSEQMINLNSNELNQRLNNLLRDAQEFKELDTNLTLSCLSHLKVKLQHIKSSAKNKFSEVNIENTEFINKVMNLELKPVYPNNPDAFVEFKTNDKMALYSNVTSFKQEKGEKEQSKIDLYVNEECCMSIFSSPNLISFIYQLLEQFNGFRPADVLQTLKIPSAKELDIIIKEGEGKEKLIKEFHLKNDQLINNIITNLIL
jgi:hypothetical protein